MAFCAAAPRLTVALCVASRMSLNKSPSTQAVSQLGIRKIVVRVITFSLERYCKPYREQVAGNGILKRYVDRLISATFTRLL